MFRAEHYPPKSLIASYVYLNLVVKKDAAYFINSSELFTTSQPPVRSSNEKYDAKEILGAMQSPR